MDGNFSMNLDYANFLAKEVIRQFQEYPLITLERTVIDRSRLAEILMQAEGFNHEKRMQFRIPKDEQLNRFNDINIKGHLLGFFYPRRIFANYDTNHKPDLLERTEQKAEEALWKARKLTFSSRVICRKLRQDAGISAIRKRSLEKGYKFSAMAHFQTLIPHLEEAPHYGGETEAHAPLIFIPGATKEDLDTMARFCIKHQNPKEEAIDHYTQHGVFQDYLYKNQRKE